ncbi:MAG: hypothetical protein RQ847_08575 [Wenzhouxiangellaceae bacterium]|nr:hypothetical protein [Wenzhouxiangellaceae bacterium]
MKRPGRPPVFAALAAAAWLGACAAPDAPGSPATPSPGPARVAALIAGEYAGRPEVTDEPGTTGPLVRLTAAIEARNGPAVALRLSQRSGDSRPRDFRMVLRPTRVSTRLEGQFSPLGPDGEPSGACPLEVSLQSDGFVARTDAQTCRFGEGRDAVALVKEIAGDGRRLVIADRVVDAATGEATSADRILELHRVREFEGWAGIRDTPGAPWRMTETVRIASDGVPVRPSGAGDMRLGIELELAPYRIARDQASLLRLRVFDVESGELLGQSWADPAATRIGLALPSVQVGLRLRGAR